MNIIMYLWSLPYMRWHIIFTITPSIIIWILYWRYLLRFKKTICYIIVCSFVWGLLFELFAAPLLHVWYFNPVQNLGVSLLGIPFEEYLFFVLFSQELAILFLIMKKEMYHE